MTQIARRSLNALSFLLAFLPIQISVTSAQQAPTKQIDSAVKELTTKAFDKKYCETHTATKVGLWQFEEGKSPLAQSGTQRVYDEMLTSLLKSVPKCVSVLDNVGIGAVLNFLSKSGALDDNGGSVLAALTETHQSVDIVVFPQLYAQDAQIFLTLRAVDRLSGQTLAQSTPSQLPKAFTAAGLSDQAQPLDTAIQQATEYLTQNAVGMAEIQTTGIFFEDSGSQPAGARFILEQIVTSLVQKTSNNVSGKKLKVRGISIEVADPVQVQAGELSSEVSAKKDGVYDLTGRYWVRGDILELQLNLKTPEDATVAWRGQIKIASLKGLELSPKSPVALLKTLPKGPFSFQVTTPKGVAPVYNVGDELTLLLRVGRDAWVYCFYVDSRQQIFPIFPPPRPEIPSVANKVPAKALLKVPDPAKDTFKFRLTADTLGEEVVACFATVRDVRPELPAVLFPSKLAPIPFLTLHQLRENFSKLAGAKVSESLVTVTILRK